MEFINLCKEINLPIAKDKTQWATKLILFLCMLVGTEHQLILIPVEKKDGAILSLRNLIKKRTVTAFKLQQLIRFSASIYEALLCQIVRS